MQTTPPFLEICINEDERLLQSVEAACQGGADRIELCSRMDLDGLTPSLKAVRSAAAVCKDRAALMVMIRPRAGDFFYTCLETAQMIRQIEAAAEAGADGVVFGAVKEGRIDLSTLRQLISAAHSCGLAVTFHRAFDTLHHPLQELQVLSALGVKRVLTAAEPWGASAKWTERCNNWRELLERADGVEVILAGGLTPKLTAAALRSLPYRGRIVSVHAYSAARRDGITDREKVGEFFEALQAFRAL
ncbi:MAG: copper homeostasis protein CutC [candidate division KSB1 bacterium]|nr:copper homeostasis protein CutC [candidate division KSB1 bacterium]